MRRYLIMAGLLCASEGGGADAGTGLAIVEDGESRAVISIPREASEQVADAAQLLSEYVEKSTSAKLSVGENTPGDDGAIVIHVGEDEFVRQLDLDLGDLDMDGFVIAFSGERDVVIVGATEWGTEFGVYEFLERYLDIRWLIPGPDGEDVPRHTLVVVPAADVRDKLLAPYFADEMAQSQASWRRCKVRTYLDELTSSPIAMVGNHARLTSAEPGVWTPVTQTFDVPREERSNKNPRYHMEKHRRKMVVRLETRDFAEDDVLFVDDLGLYVHEP